jgi:Predicted esterase
MSNVCYVPRMATNRLLRLRFEAIFICCFGVATSFGASTEPGRIVLPANSSTQTVSAGLQKLSGRNGSLHSNRSRRAVAVADLAAQGRWLSFRVVCGSGSYAPYADKGRFIILAPESPGQSWGTGPKEWGYDYVAINRALEEAFARARSIAAGSPSADFSDGASYALSLGLANGDVFSYIIAFSPGFIVRAQARGRQGPTGVEVPLIYIAHGSGR